MLDARTMTIVRNGADYLGEVLSVVAPHVKTVQVLIDSRSTDGSYAIVQQLRRKYPNIEKPRFYPVVNPLTDLVDMRNFFFPFEEKWGFILDSDEYHQDIASYELQEARCYAFQTWSVWNPTHIHKSSSKAIIPRIFKNSPGLSWKGQWGKEVLYDYGEPLFKDVVLLPQRYIHLTHLKKDKWREELNQLRVADGKFLSLMPQNIINKVREIHEKALPNL